MTSTTTSSSASTAGGSYECIHCSAPVPSLYISYKDPSNTSLSVCPASSTRSPSSSSPLPTQPHLADIYQSSPLPLILLDVLLLKPEVYRHLLRNRGGKNAEERRGHWLKETAQLGAIVIGVDAVVRCIDVPTSTDAEVLLLFAQTVLFCLIETLSLILSIAFSAFLLRPRPRRNAHTTSLHSRALSSDLLLTPLTLFYASLPLVFTLVVSSIVWRGEYSAPLSASSSAGPLSPSPSSPFSSLFHSLPAPLAIPALSLPPAPASLPPSSATRIERAVAYVASYSRASLRSPLSQTLGTARARGWWASEALLRKGVGGGSCLVGFSVLLRASKMRTAAVLVLAWLFHLVILHGVDPWLL
ncbi:hypothetical protein JCM6882_005493 [Rhodosporidiobolus microsporus]